MCSPSCFAFGERHVTASLVAGRAVLEVGSMSINGSLRAWVEALGPGRYVGVDIAEGPGVDETCDAGDLVARFGAGAFDVVISTEMLEHVHQWRAVVSNLKGVLRPGGTLIVTTRSAGFGFHGYPADYWRYSVEDFRAIFSDMTVRALEGDPDEPGVFLSAEKPAPFVERDLSDLRLYSILKAKRCADIGRIEAAVLVRYWHARPMLSRFVPAALHRRLATVLARRRAREARDVAAPR